MKKKIWFFWSAALCWVLMSMPLAYAEGEYKFWVSEDAWVNEANPAANYGNNTYLSVNDRSGLAETYIKFSNDDLGLLSGQRITFASLFLYQYQGTYSPGDAINLHKVAADWDESSLTWNSKSAFEAQNSGSLNVVSGNNQWREWTVLEDTFSSWLRGPNYGLVLENNKDARPGELFARFYSSEYSNADNRPYLRVVTATPEPVSIVLFLLGGGALFIRSCLRKKA